MVHSATIVGLGLAVLLAILPATAAGQCGTYVRASVAYNPGAGTMPNYDVYVNDKLQFASVSFRTVTAYVSVPANTVTRVGIKNVTSTGAYVASATFAAPSGSFFTVGFGGPLAGPVGQVASNTNPTVNVDVRRVPNPGRGTGLWYRWSETPAMIDFRAVAGNPLNSDCNATCISYLQGGNGCPTCAITLAADAERISDLVAKTVIPLSEFEEGVYSFYPVLPGRKDPLWNARFNNNQGGVVGVRGLTVTGAVAIANGARGTWYDFFAQGDSLLNANANNLEVKYTATTVEYDRRDGCTYVLDASNQRIASLNKWASSGASGVAAASALAVAAVMLALFA
jgi:hypothetical protein